MFRVPGPLWAELGWPWSLSSAAVGLHPSAAQSGRSSLCSVNCFAAFFVFSLFAQTKRHAAPHTVCQDADQDTY